MRRILPSFVCGFCRSRRDRRRRRRRRDRRRGSRRARRRACRRCGSRAGARSSGGCASRVRHGAVRVAGVAQVLGDHEVAAVARVVDVEAPVARVAGMEREPEEPALAPVARELADVEEGRRRASTPSWTIRIRPACSTTKSRPTGSPGAPLTKSGAASPVATGVRRSAGTIGHAVNAGRSAASRSTLTPSLTEMRPLPSRSQCAAGRSGRRDRPRPAARGRRR